MEKFQELKIREFMAQFIWYNKENERYEFYEQDVKGVATFIAQALHDQKAKISGDCYKLSQKFVSEEDEKLEKNIEKTGYLKAIRDVMEYLHGTTKK